MKFSFAVLGQEAQSESWRFLELPASWVLAMIILPLAFGIAYLAYRREPVSPGIRATLITLRSLSFLALLLVLFRPVRVESRENVEPAGVLLLVDDSASMKRKDSYNSDPELRRSMVDFAGQAPDQSSRSELAARFLEGPFLKDLEAKGYLTQQFRFSEALSPITGPDSLTANGRSTHLGSALSSALAGQRNRHITDVVVLSDGRFTGGIDPLEAGQAARAAGVEVHTLLIGDPTPEINLTLEMLDVPTGVLQGDEISLPVRITALGMDDAESEVLLEELGPEGSGLQPRAVDRQDVQLDGSSTRVVMVAPSAGVVPDAPVRRFRVSLSPLEKESVLDDNSVEVSIPVTSANLRVLYVEGFPRYEYRFLRELLRSGDERIQAQIFLMSATPDFPQDSSPGMASLDRIPTDRKELLDNYDVIILGDLDPYRISADPARGEEFVASLREFLEKGGGLCVIAGEYENPRAVAGTEFASLLPVLLDTTGSHTPNQDTEVAKNPVLSTPDAPHEILRLHPDLATNQALWESPEGLPGFLWFSPTLGAKPGSQVLLSHPKLTVGPNREQAPILVAGYYPSGRTLFLGMESTWRWRKRFQNRYHHRFWLNSLRWLALGRLRSADRKHRIDSLEPSYRLDDTIVVEARILDDDYQPSELPTLEVQWQAPGKQPEAVEVQAIEGDAGRYRLRRNVERVGTYQVWIEQDGTRIASTEFEVMLPSQETRDPSPDPATMTALAQISGGQALSITAGSTLLEAFPGDQERRLPVASELTDIWDRFATLLAALFLFTLEWILRKRYELI
ncbi:MAG: hypothetical protein P1V35_09125 [Planctomycetota bacterium]|nr:hypothetical protein [Planctomycetota bacterium]